MPELADLIQPNDLDRSIWQGELEDFVPRRVFDLHTHMTHTRFDLGEGPSYSAAGGPWALLDQGTDTAMLDAADALLLPGRGVERLILPMPYRYCDFAGSNEHVAREAARRPASAALMLVEPRMTAEEIEGAIRRHRFVGYKPYRWYAASGDVRNCRISDYMPPHQLEVANRFGLLVGLHLSKQDAIADPENLEDLERFAERFPRLRWCLFHCARSYSDWPMRRAAARLRQISNVWFDSSSVCETDAFDAMFETADPTRVCYGSDDLAVGAARGKYVAYGRAWVTMTEGNQTFNTDHCDGRMTFTRYEMLRAMRRAARHAGYTAQQVDDLFHNNAVRLIAEIRRDMEAAL